MYHESFAIIYFCIIVFSDFAMSIVLEVLHEQLTPLNTPRKPRCKRGTTGIWPQKLGLKIWFSHDPQYMV